MPSTTIAQVVIDSPLPQLDRVFDYIVPEELLSEVSPGVRVRVPLKNSIARGFVIALSHQSEFSGKIQPIAELVSPAQVLRPEIYRLAVAIAARQFGTVSDVLRLAVPERSVRVEKKWLEEHSPDGSPAADQIVEEEAPEKQVSEHHPSYARMFSKLEHCDEQGVAMRINLQPRAGVLRDGDKPLLRWAYDVVLIAVEVLRRGKDVIIAVPDFRDLGQIVLAAQQHGIEDSLVRLDAGRTPSQRYQQFLKTLVPGPKLMVGNRSALFAPSENLGLIIVWDEGDPLHDEPLTPYQHSRDVALIRQEQQQCHLVFASHSRSTAVHRLLALGWLEAYEAVGQTRPNVVLPVGQDVELGTRIPSQVWQALSAGLEQGPVLVQTARPSSSSQLHPDSKVPTVAETADQLSKAFQGRKVIVAEGAHPIEVLPNTPAIVVATRGAEPVVAGGYQAIALVDGLTMMGRESLRVTEDCLRWWSNAAALAGDGKPVFLTAISGDIAQAMVLWQQDKIAESELRDRVQLRFPPAVRLCRVSGDHTPVRELLAKVKELPGVETLYLRQSDTEPFQAIIKFDYKLNHEMGNIVREQIIRTAGARANPLTKSKPKLRVHADPLEIMVP